MEELITQLLSSVRGIWKYRWLAIGTMWLCATLGWSAVAALPDDYQTTARIFVDTQSILKPLLSGMTSMPNVEQQVAIMSRTLLSRPNVERVMRMVDLDLNANTPREHELQLDELMGKIKIGGTGSNDIYTITYNNRNPKMVRDVVQSLLTIFVEGSFKGKQDDSQKAVQFIDEQIKTYEDKLLGVENAVKQFKRQNNGLLPRQGSDYNTQLQVSSDALSAARLELMEAEQARNTIKSQVAGDEPVIMGEPEAAAIENPEIDARIAALNKNLDALRMQYTELHPDIVASMRLLAQLQQRKVEENKARAASADPGKNYSPMLQQLKIALTEADARVAAIKIRTQELGARHERLQAQGNAVPEVEAQLAQLNRDYEFNKENYEKLISRREAAKLSGELSSTTEMMTFKIIDPPTVPVRPVGPNRAMLFSLVLGASIVAGAAVALLISQVRPTFLSPAELREHTGLTVLGTVSMNWTTADHSRRRRGQVGFGAALSCLFLFYGGVMTATLLH
ncbi:MAG: XrtA system polysaccharide chain length determinant [Pseudomonadota bacterium]